MDIFTKAFAGKRVLVTGHTGFKGSWLSVWLTRLGAEVTGYALAPEQEPNHFSLLALEKRIHHIVGDIRDSAKLGEAFAHARPEIVFHLAAQALVRKSYANPVETFDVNVRGSANVLDAARNSDSVRTLVYITSDKCYHNNEQVWSYRECDSLGGHDPYSASKACAELLFSSYQDSYFRERGLNAASARAGNVIGGGDWSKDRIVPDCIRALCGDRRIELRNPTATRPWQHVLEPLSGYMLLAALLESTEGKNYRGSWNFGPHTEDCRTVLEVTRTIASHWDARGADITFDKGPFPHEAMLLQLNWEKALAGLHWKPTWTFPEGIAQTASWYQRWHNGEDVWQITSSQIDAFSLAFLRKRDAA
ncbi:MAG: CDP-glucose 4,6-dehydratase [Pseudomonadota bacterium]